jgi:L-arabinokinase
MIVFYISGHGFGHASRDIEVLNALLDRRPDLAVVVRTPAARWLFDLTLRQPVAFEAAETDTGIVQLDSLRLDAVESIRRAATFYRDLDARAAAEAGRLREARVRLVIADIPPLAFRAAALAGVPAIALGNFTWDWIYEGYPEMAAEAPDLASTLRHAYATAAVALRLPMHGGFASMRAIRDIPFVARHSRRDPAHVRAALGLPADRRFVLLSFGGHGLEGLDLDRVDARGDYTLMTTGAVPPTAHDRRRVRPSGRDDRGSIPGDSSSIVHIDERALYEVGLRYEDLVAACDVVVTKPGYGIIAECIANGTAMLYTSRGRFVEYEVLVECLPRFVRSRFISHDDLYAGAWRARLDAVLAQPAPPERPATNGADVAAHIILEMVDRL